MGLKKSAFLTLIAGVVQAAATWIMTALVARFGGNGDLGSFALAGTITIPIYAFLGMQLRENIITDATQRKAFGLYFGARIFTSVVALVASSAVGCSINNDTQGRLVVVAFASVKFIEALAEIVHGELFRTGKVPQSCGMQSMRIAMMTLVFSFVLITSGRVELALFAGFLISTAILFIIEFRQVKADRVWPIAPPSEFLARVFILLRESLPLSGGVLAANAYTHGPRYILSFLVSRDALGVYSAIYSAVGVMYLPQSALGLAAMPKLARAYQAGEISDFRRMALRIALFGLVLGLAISGLALMLGGQLLAGIYGDRFRVHGQLMVIISIASCFGCVSAALCYILQSMRMFRRAAFSSAAAALVALALTPAAIKFNGISGVPLALSAGALVSIFVSLVEIRNALSSPSESCGAQS